MNRWTDFLLVLFAFLGWSVAAAALIKSDGICRGVCEGCVYQGWCPQERDK